MPKKSINDWQIEKVIEMAEAGIPHKEIFEKTGVSKSMVSQIATDNGVWRYHTTRRYRATYYR